MPSPTCTSPGRNDEPRRVGLLDRKSTRLNSSHSQISYAVFCLKKKIDMFRTEGSVEGVKLYRMYDLTLERERAPALARSCPVLHRIRPGCLLDGACP